VAVGGPRFACVPFGVGRAFGGWCPALCRGGGSPASELEWGGSIDELLCAVEHLVRLIRLSLETHAGLRRRLGLVAGRVEAKRGNFACLEINLGRSIAPCTQPRPSRINVSPKPVPREAFARPLGRSGADSRLVGRFCDFTRCRAARWRPPCEGGALRCRVRQQTVDPLLTMRSSRQRVATHGDGFGLFLRLPRRSDLRLVATGCNYGAP
jgi:hypothetical protein